MRIHYLQHVSFEEPDGIAHWADEHNHAITGTRLDAGDPLPAPDSFDALVIMGGPMGVYETDPHPWLTDEIAFVRSVIDAGLPTLGVCLGSQIIAAALGAKVYPHSQKEIGWFPITLTDAGRDHPFMKDLPNTFTPVHWHGDTFDLPTGATLLASSQATPHQAFAYQNHVLGLQFHVEYTLPAFDDFFNAVQHELTPAPFVQDAATIRHNTTGFAALPEIRNQLLHNLFEL